MPGALLFLFALPTFVSLHGVWTTNYYYTHGYLVLALTVMLVVQEGRRARFAHAPSWWGFGLLVFVVLVTLAARAMTLDTVVQFVLPAYCVAAIWALAGWKNARRLVLPLGYLFVAIPVWGVFVPPLRGLTVTVVSAWIRAAGLPAFIEGNQIHVPSGTFEVMEGCAGLRYALVALALTTLAGLVIYRRWTSTTVVTSLALLLVLLANWLRVFITVAVGFAPGTAAAAFVRDNHSVFGWIVFVVFLIPLVYVHRKFEARSWQAPPAYVGGSASDLPSTASESGVAYASSAVLAVAIYLTVPFVLPGRGLSGTVQLTAPDVAGWTRAAAWQDSRLPVFDEANVQSAAWYWDGEARVGAYVAGYGSQQEGRELVSLANRPAGELGVATARRSVTVESRAGSSLPFQELDVSEPGDERRLVWIGLRVAGRLAAGDAAAKVLQLRGAIRGRRDAQALVLTAACRNDCADARAGLSRFAASAAESLYALAERSEIAPRESSGPRHAGGR
jgi:EpsI family protein